jgi:hypothetical protein
MRYTEVEESWVVYHIPPQGKAVGTNAVCSQHEWEAKVASSKNPLTLIRSDIKNEGEAERLARSSRSS